MAEGIPMPNDDELPTLGQLISGWLGFQLPAIPIPQTIKNLDKASGKLFAALGDNVVASIKNNTAKKTALGKIELADLIHSAEERRKLTNRVEILQTAAEEIK